MKDKKTNYEAIKEMSLEETAAMFYIFAKPFFDLLGATEEQKAQVRENIRAFLKAEIGAKRNED
jgi:hypothetical protein